MNSGEPPANRFLFSLRHWQIWAASLAFWTVYAILDTAGAFAVLALRGERVIPDEIVWNFSEAYIWVLFTPVVWAITRRYGFTGKGWKKSLAAHVSFGVLVMMVTAALLLTLLDYLGWGDTLTPFPTRLLGLACQDLPRYFVTVAVAQIVLYYAEFREHEAESADFETRLAQAQLQILRSQIEPHFLFNTLNSIATLATRDPSSAERMTLKLAGLLRVSLDCASSQEVPLRHELELLQNYLDIQQTRFCDRLKIRTSVDPEVLSSAVPSLILQPLVENAIHHGIERSARPGQIDITAVRENGCIRIEVADNGVGYGGEEGNGLGLSNTRARLQQLYGQQHSFRIDNIDGGGCRVTLTLPLVRSGKEE